MQKNFENVQSKIEIRDVKEQDIAQILKIEHQSFSDPWSEQCFEQERELSYSKFLVASIEDKIIGYISAWVIGCEANINNLAVKVEYRQKGVAKVLMSSIAKFLKANEVEFLTLEVRQSNQNAIAFYEKFGFLRLGIRPKYYLDGENAIIMQFDIKNKTLL